MYPNDLKTHALDFLKGLLAVVIVNACLAGLNFIGAHIPDAINALSGALAAYGTIHASRV